MNCNGEPFTHILEWKRCFASSRSSGSSFWIFMVAKVCWKMFNRQHMLVIDGKYNTDDGLSTTTMINRKIEDKSRKIE
jgi:hypothetical protein